MRRVPPSLSIKCEWIDQPAAQDPVEKRSWADFRLFVEGRAMTRVWDRRSQGERTSIFVPVFPLVRWIVHNWWVLLYEACRWDEVPADTDRVVTANQRTWLRRHCLRAADSGLLLPRMCVFSDGQRVCFDLKSDPPNVYSHMPAEFIESQRFWLPREAVVDGLREFVRTTIERLEDVTSPCVGRLNENWNAIINADAEEAEFCRAAGRLGRDPYLARAWNPSLVEFLETGLGSEAAGPMAGDFLDILEDQNDPNSIWQSLQQTKTTFRMGQSPSSFTMSLDDSYSPAATAYRIARDVRDKLNVDSNPIIDVRRAAVVSGSGPMVSAELPTLATPKIKAVAGWTNNGNPIIASLANIGPQNRRFLEARALFLAWYQCQGGPRLVSTAHTWSQKASRAFAAELLAPQSEIVERWDRGNRTPAQIIALANEFDVSTKVIELQLQNAGADALDV